MRERATTAQTDPDALKRWQLSSGRKCLVFNAVDLVDALHWPEGHQSFQQIIEAYRDHRQTKQSNRRETQRTSDGVDVSVLVAKGEALEPEEKRELLQQLSEELGISA